MHCPYCRATVTENAEECPACRLNLSRASALLGPVPMVNPRICDQPDLLDPAARTRLVKRLDKFERRFPQIRLQILCRNFPSDHPYALYLFWIFNLGRISSDLEKGGKNRVILIGLDPHSSRGGIMPGYGIEPFLRTEDLDAVLNSANEAWSKGAWGEGFLQIIDGLDSLLESTIYQLADVFGHQPRPRQVQRDGF